MGVGVLVTAVGAPHPTSRRSATASTQAQQNQRLLMSSLIAILSCLHPAILAGASLLPALSARLCGTAMRRQGMVSKLAADHEAPRCRVSER